MNTQPKLVRDHIPQIIQADNQKPITRVANDLEYWKFLQEKLLEEVNEFLQDPSKEEAADIQEVLLAIYAHKKYPPKEIEAYRKQKCEERGGFTKRIILEGIE